MGAELSLKIHFFLVPFVRNAELSVGLGTGNNEHLEMPLFPGIAGWGRTRTRNDKLCHGNSWKLSWREQSEGLNAAVPQLFPASSASPAGRARGLKDILGPLQMCSICPGVPGGDRDPCQAAPTVALPSGTGTVSTQSSPGARIR